MSKADTIFDQNIKQILKSGYDTQGEKVRPHWKDDGALAYTVKDFCIVNRYNLAEEFPIHTQRYINFKAAVDELLWIWQKRSNNVNDLNSHIWDDWADENGSIGKAYGYQLNKLDRYKGVTDAKLLEAFGERYVIKRANRECGMGHISKICRREDNEKLIVAVCIEGDWWMNQVDKVIYDLKLTPMNRRILTNIYCFADLSDMGLHPCAYSMTFNVTGNQKDGYKLNAILNQRSQDMLVANGWNVCQYAVLVHLIARATGLEVGEFVHVIADAHIYDRHIPIVKKVIKNEKFPAPKLVIDEGVTDFYDFTTENVRLEDYQYAEKIKGIPVAV